MSSTNRGRDRHKYDYYVTPIDDVVVFLDAIGHDFFKDKLILDCSAGGDAKNPMSYPTALKSIGVTSNLIKTMDIRDDSLAEVKADYLKTKLNYQPQIIISNPPFNIAREFIEKSLKDVANGGYVIMLLRINYFGSQKRKDMWDKIMPVYAYLHHERISFTGDGKTDSIEYAHFVWQKGNYPEFTKLKVI